MKRRRAGVGTHRLRVAAYRKHLPGKYHRWAEVNQACADTSRTKSSRRNVQLPRNIRLSNNMSIVGKNTFQVTARGITVQAQNVTWNGNSFSGSGTLMGQSFTATGTANGNNLSGESNVELPLRVFFLTHLQAKCAPPSAAASASPEPPSRRCSDARPALAVNHCSCFFSALAAQT
jgi:hypothetical protein